MPFQKGNKLGCKEPLFAKEIKKALLQGDMDRLRRIAEKLLDKAEEGDLAAINMVADRLDGKPTQTIEATMDGNLNVGGSDTFTSKLARSLGSRQTPTVQ